MSPFLAGPALIAAAAILATALPSAAQSSAPASAPGARPDSGDAGAVVPPVAYRSAFAGYRAIVDEKVGAWRDANDEVGRIGGWRVYAKQAREPEAAAGGSNKNH